MGIILAILLFSAIIIIHELGHFLLAKANGIRVDEFSLGLGPTLFGKQFGETKFSVKLLPFGGACMMGEDDVEDISEGSFNSKSVWARMSVIVAGPLFNLILAWILCMIMIAWVGYRTPVVGGVIDGYSAQEQGLSEGDVITKINGVEVPDGNAYEKYIEEHPLSDEPVTITYERNGLEYEAEITPREYRTPVSGFGYNTYSEKTSGFNVLKYGAVEVKYMIRTTILSLKELVTGHLGMKDLSGPVGVVDAIGDTYEQSKSEGTLMIWMNMLNMAVLLSANLGVMNLLPLPALDGGRLVFLVVEAVRRKPVNRQVEGMIHFAGLMLLMALMVYVMIHDVQRIL